MHRARSPRTARRFVLLIALVLASVTPVAAGGAKIDVAVLTSSPTTVTLNNAVAYPVEARNAGSNTLNSVTVRLDVPDGAFSYLGAVSSPAVPCSAPTATSDPVCTIGQVRAGADLPAITFYFRALAVGNSNVSAVVSVSEGGNDSPSSDENANNIDTWRSPAIVTEVVAANPNAASGHTFPGVAGLETVSTGLGSVSSSNRLGTSVKLTTRAEVRIRDVPKTEPDACEALVSGDCFGEASSLSINGGLPVPGGVEVTMRWDYADLPSGMNAKKLKVVHIFDDGVSFATITEKCANAAATHCFTVLPFKHADRDLQATFRLPFNGLGKGWN